MMNLLVGLAIKTPLRKNRHPGTEVACLLLLPHVRSRRFHNEQWCAVQLNLETQRHSLDSILSCQVKAF